MKLTPNITLSNGRIIGSRYMNGDDGAQDLFDVADPERIANLTETESAEVMVAIRAFRDACNEPTRSGAGVHQMKTTQPVTGTHWQDKHQPARYTGQIVTPTVAELNPGETLRDRVALRFAGYRTVGIFERADFLANFEPVEVTQ